VGMRINLNPAVNGSENGAAGQKHADPKHAGF
jgi:hypothetical protein